MKKTLDFIKSLIKHRDKAISKKMKHLHPYDVAQIFGQFNQTERNYLYNNLMPIQLADILSYLDTVHTIDYLKEIGTDKSVPILEEMSSDDITDILNEIDDEDFRAILSKFSSESQIELAYLRKYGEDQVGAIMTTNYIAVENELDVKEAMKILIQEAEDSETIDPIYITDNGKLTGMLKLVDLIIARSPKKIKELADDKIVYVNVDDNAADAVAKMDNYGLSVLPVIDQEKMVGIITIDDALDVMEKEETETYGQFAAVTIDDDNILKGTLRRIPWLLILLILGIFVSSIISVYEDFLRQVTALIFFQTLVLDMVGNISTQSLAVSIRHLVRDDLNTGRKIFKHLFKELKVSFINAAICGLMAFAVALLMLTIKHVDNKTMIALVVALSVLVSQIAGGLLGASIPIIFAKIKIDPALASGPLITTLNDVVAVVVYFSLAAVLLNLV